MDITFALINFLEDKDKSGVDLPFKEIDLEEPQGSPSLAIRHMPSTPAVYYLNGGRNERILLQFMMVNENKVVAYKLLKELGDKLLELKSFDVGRETLLKVDSYTSPRYIGESDKGGFIYSSSFEVEVYTKGGIING